MPQGQYPRVRRRSERPSEDRARREHGGYIESPKKLERQLADGLERTRLRLEQQREELRHLARYGDRARVRGPDTRK